MTSASLREWQGQRCACPGASVGDDRVVNTEQGVASGSGGRRVLGFRRSWCRQRTQGRWSRSVDPVRVHDIDEGGCAVGHAGVEGMGAVGLVKHG